MNGCSREILSSGRVRWGLFGLATQAPGEVAGHDIGDDGKQHQEHRHPKNPTVVHSLPGRRMRMVLVIMLCLVHRFPALHFQFPKGQNLFATDEQGAGNRERSEGGMRVRAGLANLETMRPGLFLITILEIPGFLIQFHCGMRNEKKKQGADRAVADVFSGETLQLYAV
jgi:hypothetical protein